MTLVSINQKFHAVPAARAEETPSPAVLKTAEMFGIGLDETYEVAVFQDLRLQVCPGDLVFITGPSGSGKSVLLGRLAEALRAAWPAAPQVDLAATGLPADLRVIDLLGEPLQDALRIASAAGLADAFLLLRTPPELSDGQRWRLRLALALRQCGASRRDCLAVAGTATAAGVPPAAKRAPGEAPAPAEDARGLTPAAKRAPGEAPAPAEDARGLTPAARSPAPRRASTPGPRPSALLVADEFCSTLDRLCARAVAWRVQRLARREGLTLLAASAHDDLVEDLAPDVLVVKHAGPRAEVHYADAARADAAAGGPSRLRHGGGQARDAEVQP
ncbi:MAG: hypothetical protein FJ288_02565 [Planctomycetes bacterium]|nr:hypothetical protein [Planctomycetota bacterium]